MVMEEVAAVATDMARELLGLAALPVGLRIEVEAA